MKITELRIGNFVKWNNNIDKVASIIQDDTNGDSIQCDNLHAERVLSEYDAIPLTEEWLLKFGFQLIQDGFFQYYVLEYWNYIKTVKRKFQISLEWMDDHYLGIWLGDGVVHIYSVHQLQNLYFALTREEL